MTMSDYNALPSEKHRGPMNELVAIRDEVIENAWLKAEASSLAMDRQAITEMAIAASMQAPTMPETLQTDDPAAMHLAFVTDPAATYPEPQMAGEQNMLTESDQAESGYLDQMAAEARVAQSYADNEALGERI